MARKPKAAAGANLVGLLQSAAQANSTNVPFYATKAEMQPLVAHALGQLVEFNEGMQQGDKIAFRASALGLQALATGQLTGAPTATPTPTATWGAPAGAPAPAPAQQQPGPSKTFTFKKGIPIPTAKRGGKGQAFGFEQMEVGDAFDVAATADNPNPSKRIASNVSGATKRLAPKTFIVRSIEENGVKIARVWRTA